MSQKKDEWSPAWLLEAWGLRAFGALTTPWKPATGGEAISDDESQAAWYVENTPGFEKAREVLVWRYQRGREFSEFRLRGPGESLVRALLRRSWGHLLGSPPSQVARSIHDEFFARLSDRVLEKPFQPIRAADEESDDVWVRKAS